MVQVLAARVSGRHFCSNGQSAPVTRTGRPKKTCRAMIFLRPGRPTGQCAQVTRASGREQKSCKFDGVFSLIVVVRYSYMHLQQAQLLLRLESDRTALSGKLEQPCIMLTMATPDVEILKIWKF